MPSDPLLGRVIDKKYRIDAQIGLGGMATVYRATRLHIGDVVAIKILHAELLRDPKLAERFQREAQAAARLKHPNVVTVHDFGVCEDDVVYLVMELVEGENLRTMIKDDVSFSYKLLRFTNSALFAHQSEIRTIERALLVLGEEGIRRWVAVAALPLLAADKPHELVVQSLLRARFAEELGRTGGFSPPPICFQMGLFSLLDALLDRTIEYALQQIRLAPVVEQTLLGTAPSEDRVAIVYALVCCYELGDWDTVTVLADQLGVPAVAVGEAYLNAAYWVAEVTAGI